MSSRLAVCALIVAMVLPVASCHPGLHPLQAAEACRCSPSEYCHVDQESAAACLPIPKTCTDKPSCACIGRPIDACREELGAVTVLEPRRVARCADCSSEEYCWTQDGPPMCRVLPARCDETPTCDCLVEARGGRVACDERQGRLEARPASAH